MASAQRLTRPVHPRRQHRGPRVTGHARDQAGAGHTALVTLPAEIDLLSAPEAGDRLRAALPGGHILVIADLTGTSFCDVAAARMLLRVQHDVASDGAQLRLAVPAGPVHRVLELLGLDGQLDLYPCVLDAAGGTATGPASHLTQRGAGAAP